MGNFVINDHLFGLELNGIFYAFDSHGNVICKKYFNANLFNAGISSDGRYAVCQTCNSDNADSSLLSFFDLQIGKIIWQKQPELGWCNEYEFNLSEQRLYLIDDDSDRFSYSFLGDFLDVEKLEAKRLKEAGGFELHEIARKRLKELGKSIDSESGKEILSLLKKALKQDLDEYPNEKAKVCRTTGEVYEALGDRTKAINHYEKALKLNPKVGIKRKLEALKSE